MKKEIILFDLDGMLTDPVEGITKSVQYALGHYGICEEDLWKLTPFIGPPLRDSFMKYYGFSKAQADEAVWVYREYFAEKGIFENREIPGIRKMLETLAAAGRKLYVATSKPEIYARQILAHFQMDSYFLFIGGADMGETRVRKGDVIRYVLEEAGFLKGDPKEASSWNGISPESVVMAGDREHDILGAKENGIHSVGFLMGYGSREELLKAGADRIAEDAEAMTRILLENWGD